jgi:hypothetical protein
MQRSMRETASVAETDILNPVRGYWDELGDNPNWSYGWVRKTSTNKQIAKPRLGRRYSRELLNGGYSGNLLYIDRPYSTVLYLKRFFEQFQSGYFTLIDRDGGHRHHVGNFTTEPNAVQQANGKYTIQGLTFEEAPQARMLEYPNDFEKSSHWIFTLDDYLSPRVASQGTWVPQLTPAMAGTTLNAPTSYELFNATPVAGDIAQVEYVGWGFQMTFRNDPSFGICSIYVDEHLFISNLNLSTGISVGGAFADPTNPFAVGGIYHAPPIAGGFVQCLPLPLDKHRVKVVASGGPQPIIFPAIQVMH